MAPPTDTNVKIFADCRCGPKVIVNATARELAHLETFAGGDPLALPALPDCVHCHEKRTLHVSFRSLPR